jgi:hypothetical protein
VDADTDTVSPSATAWAASSAELHRDNGTSRCAGGWQAIALTPATTGAESDRGRPDRGWSASPSRPASVNRLRHRPTTPTCTSNRSAMAVLGTPSAASSTILARTTSAKGAV